MTKHVIAVVGPTAIGKTKLAIALANHFNTEIISADSRQFYKEMNIGTAVPTSEELAQAPHHFIQHRSIEEPYSVGHFEKDAIQKLEQLFMSHDIVILVGGSGLYVDAVQYGLNEFPEISPEIRKDLKQDLESEGIQSLVRELEQKDPLTAERIDSNNPQRVLRALEVCRATGKTYSYFTDKEKPKRSFNTIKIGLTANREYIYDRINQRVDLMITQGLEKEAEKLLPKKKLNALNTVGYKELFRYFEGSLERHEAIEEIKKNTRRFAKRQLTWYRKDKEIYWYNSYYKLEDIVSKITSLIK